MDIEFANRVIDNASMVLNGFLVSCLWNVTYRKDYWHNEWNKARSEAEKLELNLHQCKACNRSLYQELGKFDKERCEYYFHMANELAKFNRVGGSDE